MKLKYVEHFLSACFILGMLSLLVYWRTYEIPLPEIATANRDGAGDRKPVLTSAKIGENFKKFSELTESEKSKKFSNWNRFRGENFSNIVTTDTPLNFDLNKAKTLWKIPLGEGYSAPVVYNGKVYILDYDESSESDALRCFAISDGRELWQRSYKIKIRRNHGKSRTVVCADEGVVLSFGPMAQVMCVDAENGNFLWGKDLAAEFGSEIPQWYSGQCPMIYNSEAILAPAGQEVLLIGIDLKTGKTNWSLENKNKFQMSHSSIMLMEFFGQKQFVYCALGGVIGVSAEGVDKGKELWCQTVWKPNVFAPSPIKISDDKIFLTAGYGAGGAILNLKKNESTYQAEITKSWKARQGAACEQQTPIIFDNYLMTILPKDAGALNALLVACDINDNLKIVAESPRSMRFGLGPYMAINDKILVLDDDGKLSVLTFNNSEFKIISSKKILDGVDSWGPMAFSDGLLILRDSTAMICLDLRKAENE